MDVKNDAAAPVDFTSEAPSMGLQSAVIESYLVPITAANVRGMLEEHGHNQPISPAPVDVILPHGD